MFTPISINAFLKQHKKNNPDTDMVAYRRKLGKAVEAKKDGTVCYQCGQPIWAIGVATVEWNGCFACITGEADNSDDYEIESVCF